MGVLYKRTIKYSNTLKGMFKIWTQGKDKGWLTTLDNAIKCEKKDIKREILDKFLKKFQKHY